MDIQSNFASFYHFSTSIFLFPPSNHQTRCAVISFSQTAFLLHIHHHFIILILILRLLLMMRIWFNQTKRTKHFGTCLAILETLFASEMLTTLTHERAELVCSDAYGHHLLELTYFFCPLRIANFKLSFHLLLVGFWVGQTEPSRHFFTLHLRFS